jgi:hypothetical protein
MSWPDFLEGNYRLHFFATQVVTAILIFVGVLGALGAFLDATRGAGYYDLKDALRCLGLAAFGLLYRLAALPFYRLLIDTLKGDSK